MLVPHPPTPSLFQGLTICLAPRRGQEDCPRLAAPTTTPGIDFVARHHPSPHRRSGPKPSTLREAAQPTAMRESESGRGKESGREKERKETHPSEKKRRIKTGEFEAESALRSYVSTSTRWASCWSIQRQIEQASSNYERSYVSKDD